MSNGDCMSLRDRQGKFLDRFHSLAIEAYQLGMLDLAQAICSLGAATAGGLAKECEEVLYPLRLKAVAISHAAIAAGPGSVDGVVQ